MYVFFFSFFLLLRTSVLSGGEDKVKGVEVCEVTGRLWKRYRSRCVAAAVHVCYFLFLVLSISLSSTFSGCGGVLSLHLPLQ